MTWLPFRSAVCEPFETNVCVALTGVCALDHAVPIARQDENNDRDDLKME